MLAIIPDQLLRSRSLAVGPATSVLLPRAVRGWRLDVQGRAKVGDRDEVAGCLGIAREIG